jgi:L-ascorbate metabolism protein UlaG (beta-lactamase superfamily)
MHITLLILALFLIPTLGIFVTGALISAPRYKGPVSDHFDGSKFINPGGVKASGGRALLKWMLNRQPGRWIHDERKAYGPRPLKEFKDGIRVTFINHSTFLIQVDGVNILTDPVWSRRASPYRWIGPKRMRPPGIRLEDLPRIHLVLLSHNHYDHLDLDTMRTIFGAHHPRIVVPLGVKAFLDSESISGASEVDWWQSVSFDGRLEVEAVPAQHFSGRGLFDRDATLWCGYVLKTSVGNIYFAGDTGYNDRTFKEIGEKCGPMALSMLPIGAYKPEWFMGSIHVSPEESVKIHRDVKSAASIGMHFGTFPLADDGQDDPARDLDAAKQVLKVQATAFVAPKEGEPLTVE